MRWLNSIMNSMHINLDKPQEIVGDKETWCAASMPGQGWGESRASSPLEGGLRPTVRRVTCVWLSSCHLWPAVTVIPSISSPGGLARVRSCEFSGFQETGEMSVRPRLEPSFLPPSVGQCRKASPRPGVGE